MHSVFARNNAIVAYTLSVSACLTFCCFLSTVFIDYRANANLNTVKVAVNNYKTTKNFKFVIIYYNCKIYFFVVLWDKIVLRGDNAVLDFKNMNTKYYFWDDGNGLRGNKNVTLTLSWNIIPNAGLLPSVNALGSHTFAFPSEYTSLRV
ncbi:Signal peptidase complex subunit 3 [Habropoda laboriosa]|uniref:Signal peptidase complex subunit 3 n=1 Tax=Habropoda laboriosa TaxID=597456 RepID=A0A0L7RK45_9HYME|nr:Signal peptidase complex subunit 3 [Habropoda laboriosa]